MFYHVCSPPITISITACLIPSNSNWNAFSNSQKLSEHQLVVCSPMAIPLPSDCMATPNTATSDPSEVLPFKLLTMSFV